MINYYEEEGYNGETNIRTYSTEAAGTEASIMIDLVARWGMVAGQPDGEDSSGRSRIRLATPTELVERAEATTKLLLERLRANDYVITIPAPKPSLSRAERKRLATAEAT